MGDPEQKPGLAGLADRARRYYTHQGLDLELLHRGHDITTGLVDLIHQAIAVHISPPHFELKPQNGLAVKVALSRNIGSVGDGVALRYEISDPKLSGTKPWTTQYCIGYSGGISMTDNEGNTSILRGGEVLAAHILFMDTLNQLKEVLQRAIEQ